MTSGERGRNLFRKEAFEAKAVDRLGTVVLIRPISFSFLAGFAFLCTLAMFCLFYFVSYTRRTQVVGLLVPTSGLVKVVAPQSGLLIDQRVVEGQDVRQGDVLFVLSNERTTQNGRAANAVDAASAISSTFSARRGSLLDVQRAQEQTGLEHAKQISSQISGLETELRQMDSEIAVATTRGDSTKSQLEALKALVRDGVVPPIVASQKQDELLDQQVRISELNRSRLTLQRQIASARADLRQIWTNGLLQKAQSEYSLSELKQADLAADMQARILITAPQDGMVTGILAQAGQSVPAGPLVTILPHHAVLEAELYVPARAAGFVEPGQRVRLRFSAFPYQKFGQYEGTVVSISRTALLAQELPPQYAAQTQQAGGEGSYRLKVRLDRQWVMAYGKPVPLTAGMQLEADIMQDRRTLLGWIFEPLHTLRGQYGK
jgi:membrane fusion protein